MPLQILLQFAVSFDKLPVVHERWILTQLFGDFWVTVQKVVEAGELSPSHVVTVLCLRRHSLRLRARRCESEGDSTTHQQHEAVMGKIISAFHKVVYLLR